MKQECMSPYNNLTDVGVSNVSVQTVYTIHTHRSQFDISESPGKAKQCVYCRINSVDFLYTDSSTRTFDRNISESRFFIANYKLFPPFSSFRLA